MKPADSFVLGKAGELAGVCRRFGVRRLDLFGSAASDRFEAQGSDLDFLVEFENQAIDGYSDRYFGLLEALEALFNRSVDLVTPASIRNPYFLRAVQQSRVPVYEADDPEASV